MPVRDRTTLSEPLLRLSDVAEFLKVSRGTVYTLIQRGEIVPLRVSDSPRFEPAQIRAYLGRLREERGP